MRRESFSSRNRRRSITSSHRGLTSLSSHRRRTGLRSSRRRHGMSNSNAFAIGRATGVNINGSSMGAHGAALHRSAERRKKRHSRIHTSSISRNHSNFNHGTNLTEINQSYKMTNSSSKTASSIIGIFTTIYILIFLTIIGAIILMILKLN